MAGYQWRARDSSRDGKALAISRGYFSRVRGTFDGWALAGQALTQQMQYFDDGRKVDGECKVTSQHI